MSIKKVVTKSAKETQVLAKSLAQEIIQKKLQKTAMVISLEGDLGAGKTTFVQGFAEGLGISEKILSPTFVVMKKFQIPKYKSQKNSKFPPTLKLWRAGKIVKAISYKLEARSYKHFYHLDCYRLDEGQSVGGLGFEEIIRNPENIVAIEWPEKIAQLLFQKNITVQFKHGNEETRTLTISY